MSGLYYAPRSHAAVRPVKMPQIAGRDRGHQPIASAQAEQGSPAIATLLHLQRTAGNQAVAQWLRQNAARPPVRAPRLPAMRGAAGRRGALPLQRLTVEEYEQLCLKYTKERVENALVTLEKGWQEAPKGEVVSAIMAVRGSVPSESSGKATSTAEHPPLATIGVGSLTYEKGKPGGHKPGGIYLKDGERWMVKAGAGYGISVPAKDLKDLSAVLEAYAADLYQLFLSAENFPEAKLVTGATAFNPDNSLMVGSKMIPGFTSWDDVRKKHPFSFPSGKDPLGTEKGTINEKPVHGLTGSMAVSHFLAETDTNPGNIGMVEGTDAVKFHRVDPGESLRFDERPLKAESFSPAKLAASFPYLGETLVNQEEITKTLQTIAATPDESVTAIDTRYRGFLTEYCGRSAQHAKLVGGPDYVLRNVLARKKAVAEMIK